MPRLFIVLVFLALCVFIGYGFWAEKIFVTTPVTYVQNIFKVAPTEIKLLFVGDILFDRTIRLYAEREGLDYPFSCMKDRLLSYDAVIGNLEGPITTFPSVSMNAPIGHPDNTRFTFHPETGEVLSRHNFRVMNIGNNHSNDFGPDGVVSTREFLKMASVAYFGDKTESGKIGVHVERIQGVPIAFVSFNEWFGTFEEALLSVRELSAVYPVVVYTHWGDEYVAVPERVRRYAHALVDAGADIIIGSHPHVIQEIEMYKNVPIYYSLGNFMFDQYWDTDVQTGLAVEVTMDESGVVNTSSFRVINGRDRRTCEKEVKVLAD